MDTSFAALVYRDADIPERVLSQGFAIALGGWDVPAPHLLVAPLRGLPGWSAAFYSSGARAQAGDDEFDHICELFEDELSPAQCVLESALELAPGAVVVHALTYTDAFVHDDAWRFGPEGVERRFVREGEDGLEAGFETPVAGEVRPVDVVIAPDATEAEEDAAWAAATRPVRGTSFLERELGAPVLAALVGALFAPERRVEVRLADPTPEGVVEYLGLLHRVLGRTDARGSFDPPKVLAGVSTSAAFAAFVAHYDWSDPTDRQDVYRELAIGRIEGSLRFFREGDLLARAEAPAFERIAAHGYHPLATLLTSGKESLIALGADGERLVVVGPQGRADAAGPTFSELIRYLALGWKRRTPLEEELMGALMLKARLRVEASSPMK